MIQDMGPETEDEDSMLKIKLMSLICGTCQSKPKTPHTQPWAYQPPNYTESGPSLMF